MISLKLRKSPTIARCSPRPASSGCANAPATRRPSSVMSPMWMTRRAGSSGSAQPTAPPGLFLRSHPADQVLVIERRDHERVIRKSGLAHDGFDFRLGRKVVDIDRAAGDRLHIGKRRPNEVL